MLCQECDKRERCKRLCERAERYVNQDYKSQRESCYPPVREWEDATKNLPLDNISYHVAKSKSPWLPRSFPTFDEIKEIVTPLQYRCLKLFCEGNSYAQIAKKVNRKVTTVTMQLHYSKQQIRKESSKSRGGVSL